MKKFLADESVDFRIVRSLRDDDYEIQAIVELDPGLSDDDVLKMANDIEAILITEDKDFGELTFRLKKPNKGIILIRMSGVPIQDKIDKIKLVLQDYIDQLSDSFTIISENKIRIKHKKGN